jgi:hypothetical protein
MLRMCVYMHSHFVENHPIRILEDGPLISEGVLSHPLWWVLPFPTTSRATSFSARFSLSPPSLSSLSSCYRDDIHIVVIVEMIFIFT